MITKAIILGKESNTNKYIIRLPLLETAASQEQFKIKATLCCDDGVCNPFNLNDVVYVDFEDGLYGKPVILGKLSKEGLLDNTKDKPASSYRMNSLEVVGTTQLSKDVKLGDISYQDLYTLIQKASSLEDKCNSGYFNKDIGIYMNRATLRLNLNNFTKEDIGKEIRLYRTTYGKSKGYKYPGGDKHPGEYGYGALIDAATGHQRDGLPSSGHNYPAVPEWMPNDGYIQTSWIITEENIANGYMDIDYMHDWVCLIIPRWSGDYIEGYWEWSRIIGTKGNIGAVKIKFGLISSGSLQLMSSSTIHLGHNYNGSAELMTIDDDTGEVKLNRSALYLSVK